METVDLKLALPPQTYIYVGRRVFRHKDEPNVHQEEREEKYPEQFPHTFIDFAGVKLSEILEHAGGKQGCVVDTQKVVRDKHTLREVQAWREGFTVEMLERVLANCQNFEGDEQKILDNAEPFVVISFKTAGARLSVPKQPEDILEQVLQVPMLAGQLEGMSREEQLEQAPKLLAQLQAVMEALK